MDAKRAIREIVAQMPNFFSWTYKETIGHGHYQTRVYSQDEIAGHVATTLLDKLGDKGCRVVSLPPVETDEYGCRTVRVPIIGQGWAYGEIRISDNADQLVIVDIPSRLPVDSAPAVAAALLATHAAARTYQSAWERGE